MFCNPLVLWSKDCNFWFKGTLAEKSALFCLSQGKKHNRAPPPPPSFPAVCAYLHSHLLFLGWRSHSFLNAGVGAVRLFWILSGGLGAVEM